TLSYGGNSANKHETTYFRHEFNVVNPAAYSMLLLRLLRDDGAIAFLNGTQIVSTNMPAAPITYTTLAVGAMSDAEENNFFWFNLDETLLVPGPNWLAIEVHQSSITSSDISFDAELIGTDVPLISRGPYMQLTTETSAFVKWRTATTTSGRVRYGLDPSQLTSFVDDPATGRSHLIQLTGLMPGTRYYYSVETFTEVLAGADFGHTFRSSPPVGTVEPVRIWVLGDSGEANQDARDVRDAWTSFNSGAAPDVFLMLGDNAYPNGTTPQYQAAVFDMYPTTLRRSSMWPTRGNHENTGNTYFGLFEMPTAGEAGGLASGTEAYYSFDHANIHFICLDSDSTNRAVGGAMYLWAEADIMNTTQDWTIAFWHHPPYTKGSHDSDTEVNLMEMRQNFLPMLESVGVDLVLCGHSHSYERSMLLDGHYGLSSSFDPGTMAVDSGDGDPQGNGAYNKAAGGNAGTVYAVAGSSSKLSSGALDHPVMTVARMELGSMVIDVDGGRLDARFLRENGVIRDSFTLLNETFEGSYCAAAPHAEGCVVTVSGVGTPSVTPGTPFEVVGSSTPASQPGLFFYGFGPANAPFNSGRRCVKGPLQRTPPQFASGAAACSGELRYDFGAWIQSGIDGGLTPGVTVHGQWWYRDPAGPFGSELSEALQMIIRP
ncbi:MAG: hypothetical protein ACI841_005268, partial [Planctomycetota bacterium]